jgi:hypothetical protein
VQLKIEVNVNKHVRQKLYSFLLITGAYLALVFTAKPASTLLKIHGITQLRYYMIVASTWMLMAVHWLVAGSTGIKININNQIGLEV